MTYQSSPLTSATDTPDRVPDSPLLPNVHGAESPGPDGASSSAHLTQLWQHPALTVIGRLLLLGLGVPVAWLLGIGAAQVLGHRSSQMPLQETALRQTNRVIREVRYLPDRWRQPDRSVTRVEPVPIPTQPIEPLSQATATLSPSGRQVALEEVDAIATELRSLNRRLIDLETRLGRAQSTADLESRLTAIRAGLAEGNRDEAAAPTSPLLPSVPVAVPNPLLETTDLQVTLPSDALFVPGEARLLETAPAILSTILSDLNRYPNATILIGSHTDDRSEAMIGRELAFRQAAVLQNYLATSLGAARLEDGNLGGGRDSGRDRRRDSERRWVTIGYGQSQPLGHNDTPEARQRNRRVEISVDRR